MPARGGDRSSSKFGGKDKLVMSGIVQERVEVVRVEYVLVCKMSHKEGPKKGVHAPVRTIL